MVLGVKAPLEHAHMGKNWSENFLIHEDLARVNNDLISDTDILYLISYTYTQYIILHILYFIWSDFIRTHIH